MSQDFTFGSVCSGIGAPELAWRGLPWRCAFQSEIEKFPCAVLKQRFPGVPLHGDFTTIEAGDYEPIDLLVGGTPCQSFSLAGLRGGLADGRGNLALEYIRLAGRLRPRWLVWENVAGVLSSASHSAPDIGAPPTQLDLREGAEMATSDQYGAEELHALNCFLAGLSEVGYGFAYRVFDAQFAGVPQRRRRIFLVGYLGDWRPAAAVLIEPESLQGHPAPRREAGAVAAALSANGVGVSGADDNQARGGNLIASQDGYRGGFGDGLPVLKAKGGDAGHGSESLVFGGNNCSGPIDVAPAVDANGGPHGRLDFESEALVTHTLRGEGFDASEDGTGRGTPIVAVPINMQVATRHNKLGRGTGFGIGVDGDPAFTIGATHQHAVAFTSKDHGADASDIAPTLRAMGHDKSHANAGGQVAVAFHQNSRDELRESDNMAALTSGGGKPGQSYPAIRSGQQVRRLTPVECERLQGMPDNWTAIDWRRRKIAEDEARYYHGHGLKVWREGADWFTRVAPDGPRYQAIGNSMALPDVRWIGERIDRVDQLLKSL